MNVLDEAQLATVHTNLYWRFQSHASQDEQEDWKITLFSVYTR